MKIGYGNQTDVLGVEGLAAVSVLIIVMFYSLLIMYKLS